MMTVNDACPTSSASYLTVYSVYTVGATLGLEFEASSDICDKILDGRGRPGYPSRVAAIY